jgi:hypothetical protein
MISSSSVGVGSVVVPALGGDSETCLSCSVSCDVSNIVASPFDIPSAPLCSISMPGAAISPVDALQSVPLTAFSVFCLLVDAKNGLAATSSSWLDPRYLLALFTAMLSSASTAVKGLFGVL